MLASLLPFLLFAFVSSITPGPNNIMLTSSGALFGFLRSIPHMLGVTVGFGIMLAVCAVGIGAAIVAVPWLHLLMKILGSGYLLYLAWRLRTIKFDSKDQAHSGTAPMSFIGAVLFQFINPKAWVMGITGSAAFLPSVQPLSAAIGLFCLIFSTINLPCIGLWTGAGAILRRYLEQPAWQRRFGTTMALLTAYAAASIWR